MEDAVKYYGKKITSASIDEEELILTFDDCVSIRIFDGGQDCCEHRYMTTDDDVQSLVGNVLLSVEEKGGPDMDSGEVHETCFIEVATSGGFITLTNHNEHNGYYGGFRLCISEA